MSHDPVTGKFTKGNKYAAKPGECRGQRFTSKNQPSEKSRAEGQKKRKRTMDRKNKKVVKKASELVGKTFEVENLAQEKMAESDYNPVLKTIRLAKYHQNVLKLHFARFTKDRKLMQPKASHKHIHLKSYVDHLVSLLPYFSQKAAKKTVRQEIVREVHEIPEFTQEDLDEAAAEFDDLFGGE